MVEKDRAQSPMIALHGQIKHAYWRLILREPIGPCEGEAFGPLIQYHALRNDEQVVVVLILVLLELNIETGDDTSQTRRAEFHNAPSKVTQVSCAGYVETRSCWASLAGTLACSSTF